MNLFGAKIYNFFVARNYESWVKCFVLPSQNIKTPASSYEVLGWRLARQSQSTGLASECQSKVGHAGLGRSTYQHMQTLGLG